jgi:hypothetical protein
MQCDMADLRETSYIDPDFADLIEWAILESQIDGCTTDLAWCICGALNDTESRNLPQLN